MKEEENLNRFKKDLKIKLQENACFNVDNFFLKTTVLQI